MRSTAAFLRHATSRFVRACVHIFGSNDSSDGSKSNAYDGSKSNAHELIM